MSASVVSGPVAPSPASEGGILSSSSHAYVLVFHVGVKLVAVLSYMLMFFVLEGFVVAFMSTVVALAVDFWFTKNVSGRLLAGMRWWSYVREDGTSEWKFETLGEAEMAQLNNLDKQVFWKSLYLFAAYWVLAAVFNLVTLDANNFVLCVIGATFATSNVLGYRKCAKAKNQISALTAVKLMSAATKF